MEEPRDLTQELAENNQSMAAVQAKIIEATAQFQQELQAYSARDAELRAAIAEGMKVSGTKKFENEYIKFNLIAATTRTSVDADALKFLAPEIYEQVKRVSNVRESVRITIKKPKEA